MTSSDLALPQRLRQRVRHRSGRRRAAAGPQQPAARAARPVCRADLRHRLHRAARREPAHLDVPPPAVGGRRRATRRTRSRYGRPARPAASRMPPDPLRWHPFADPRRAARLRRRPAHRSSPTATPRRRPAWPRMSTSPTARWSAAPSSTPTARCCSCRSRAACAITTELGVLDVKPGEVALLPRGMAFKVALPDGPSRGYVCENYGAPFRLPELGPIGSNGLANARDFLAPVAAFEDDGRRATRWSRSSAARCGARRRKRTRRSTWWPGTATWRR